MSNGRRFGNGSLDRQNEALALIRRWVARRRDLQELADLAYCKKSTLKKLQGGSGSCSQLLLDRLREAIALSITNDAVCDDLPVVTLNRNGRPERRWTLPRKGKGTSNG